MKKLAHPFALALFFTMGSCITNDPAPVVVPIVMPGITTGTTAVVPDDGMIHTVYEAMMISSFLRFFFDNKLTYSLEESVPLFSSKIQGSSGEAITSGLIVVNKIMGVIEEYKVHFDTDFTRYADIGFVVDGDVSRYIIFSAGLEGNSMKATSLYVEFEVSGRKIKDTIDVSYSFMKNEGLSYYTIKNSFNSYYWTEQ
jgi:hypothetical protein